MTGAQRGEADEEHGADTTPAPPPPEDRRGALGLLLTVGGLAYAGALAVPAARFVVPAEGAGAGRERWIRVARLADLPAGEPRRVAITGERRDAFTRASGEVLGAVWIVRDAGGVRAWSAACPHLGCSIDVAPDAKGFACPCHTSRFSAGGEVVSGPSPRGMDPLAARVAGGFVEVDFRRFRQGVADRVEARG